MVFKVFKLVFFFFGRGIVFIFGERFLGNRFVFFVCSGNAVIYLIFIGVDFMGFILSWEVFV